MKTPAEWLGEAHAEAGRRGLPLSVALEWMVGQVREELREEILAVLTRRRAEYEKEEPHRALATADISSLLREELKPENLKRRPPAAASLILPADTPDLEPVEAPGRS